MERPVSGLSPLHRSNWQQESQMVCVVEKFLNTVEVVAVLILLIIMAGDVEQNPGPGKSEKDPA